MTRSLLHFLIPALLLMWVSPAFGIQDDRRKEDEERARDQLDSDAAEEAREKRERRKRLDKRDRTKHDQTRNLARSVIESLPQKLQEKLERLDPNTRKAIERRVVYRMVRGMRDRIQKSLTKEEREALSKLRGKQYGQELMRICREKQRLGLTGQDREKLEKLAPEAQEKELDTLVKKAREAEIAAARKDAGRDLEKLLALPEAEIKLTLRERMVDMVVRSLEKLGVHDPDAKKTLMAIEDEGVLRAAMGRLWKIRRERNPERRTTLVKELLEKIRKGELTPERGRPPPRRR